MKELEEAIQILKYQLNTKNTDVYTPINYQAIETVLQSLENSIPKEVIEEKIEEINKEYEKSKDENGETEYYYPNYTIDILQEILEGK